MAAQSSFVCHGCGAVVDAAATLPFGCPNAVSGDDIDHVLAPVDGPVGAGIDGGQANPFLRYRALLSPYRLARRAGLSEGAWADIVGILDADLARVDGHGFLISPISVETMLAGALAFPGRLLVKDETGNVAGSHKARHLMGVMLYLRVVEAAGLPSGRALAGRRLAIASCGNAALAAGVIAAAARWPLDVFVPPEAPASVMARLRDLGAALTICERRSGEAGDPCVLRFREAVAAGAIPFGVQGSDNGLAIEGGRTLAFEMAEGFRALECEPDILYVQVGGGALASALAQGFALARRIGLIGRVPRLMAVQTEGCAPLARAWARLGDGDLASAARSRSRFMAPWESVPASLASGILDDETYDWWAIAEGMRASGGTAVVAPEAAVRRALVLARAQTAIPVSATGSAGLAGLIAAPPAGGDVALIFSGAER